MDNPVPEVPEASCFVGTAMTGKTQSVIDRVCRLCDTRAAEDGRTPDGGFPSILVICASPVHKDAFERRLSRVLPSRGRELLEDAGGSGSDRPSSVRPTDARPGSPSGVRPTDVRPARPLDARPARPSDARSLHMFANVRVALAYDVALEIVADPVVQKETGRRPRLMEPYEERILFEDMRVISEKGKRIRQVMDFLQCGWSNLSDDDPAWLKTVEERQIAGRMNATLSFTGGILRDEVSNFAVNALRRHPVLRERYGFDHVLVDDYAMLGRASQALAVMLAKRSVTVAADPTPCGRIFEPYPNADGVAEFLSANPNAHYTELTRSYQSRAAAQAAANVAASLTEEGSAQEGAADLRVNGEGGVEGAHKANVAGDVRNASGACGTRGAASALSACRADDDGRFAVSMTDGMAGELRAIALFVLDAAKAGRSVMVVGANSVWRKNVERALASVGISTTGPSRPLRVSDFRDQRTCERLRADARAKLAVDPSDGVAWRTLIALGDYTARSAAVDMMREFAEVHATQERPLRLVDVLSAVGGDAAFGALGASGAAADGVSENGFGPQMRNVRAIYRREREMLRQRQGALTPNAADASATSQDTTGDARGGSVLVCSLREACGRHADDVVLGGFVDGIIPSRAYKDPTELVGARRRRERIRDLQDIYLAVGSARCNLLVSGFTSCSLDTAERMRLHIVRTQLRKGVRMSTIAPSEFLPVLTGAS